MNFEQASAKAARDFLQTAVVVDNRAAYQGEEEVEELVAPDDLATVPAETEADGEPEAAASAVRSNGALDASSISAAFSLNGLVCSILRPTETDRLKEAILKASANADVLVLDWQMHDNGELATDIIRELIQSDKDAGGRLRLVAIYTGVSPLKNVHGALAAAYSDLHADDKTLSFNLDSARIIVLGKDGPSNDVSEANFILAEENLPERLVTEFAKFAGGLLPNATLAAIGGLRRHTHRLLARFDKSLDGPYLTHRALLQSPGEAEEYAADLIMSELDAQVPIDLIIREFLGKDSVRAYLDYRHGQGKPPKLVLAKDGSRTHELTTAKACDFIETGASALDSEFDQMMTTMGVKKDDAKAAWKRKFKTEIYEKLYLLANDNLADSRKSHDNFAVRSKFKRDIGTDTRKPDPLPVLQLGAVIHGSERFWLCLTPLCDSGRMKPEGDRLLFAELTKASDGFDLIVHFGESTRLELARKRTNLASFFFKPDATGYVRGVVDGDAIVFDSEKDSEPGTPAVRFSWIGQLKRMHAQRIAQAFASNLARVGLDDFEWHRRQLPSGE